MKKAVTRLTIEDLQKYPVWEYQWNESDRNGDTIVKAIESLPVSHLNSAYTIGARVRFANGTEGWALLENVETKKPQSTRHFLHLSFERNGQWFGLARYFDPWYVDRRPEKLAAFLGMKIDEIFPIFYDVQPYVSTASDAHTGLILQEPQERLTPDQLMNLNA